MTILGGFGDRRTNYAWFGLTVMLSAGIVLFNSDERLAFSVHNTDSVASGLNGEKPNPIYQISILGERNSGTRWLYE